MLGRTERTLFTLQWLSDPALRQRSHAGLNKGEASNSLRRAVFFHRQGEIRDRTFENQTGPGHGGPGLVANAYLEGTYSEVYPNISSDEAGMKRLFTQFSFPGGIPSHCSLDVPLSDVRRSCRVLAMRF